MLDLPVSIILYNLIDLIRTVGRTLIIESRKIAEKKVITQETEVVKANIQMPLNNIILIVIGFKIIIIIIINKF